MQISIKIVFLCGHLPLLTQRMCMITTNDIYIDLWKHKQKTALVFLRETNKLDISGFKLWRLFNQVTSQIRLKSECKQSKLSIEQKKSKVKKCLNHLVHDNVISITLRKTKDYNKVPMRFTFLCLLLQLTGSPYAAFKKHLRRQCQNQFNKHQGLALLTLS